MIIAITKVLLDPTADGINYRALEVAVNLAKVPLTDKLDLHQCIGDMLRDELVNLALALRKLEEKYKDVLENRTKERASARDINNNLHNLRRIMSEK